jgi:hypothetical protein
MTTLDIIAALIVAVRRNDIAAIARLLDALLPIEEQVGFLEAIFGERPTRQERAATPVPKSAACT